MGYIIHNEDVLSRDSAYAFLGKIVNEQESNGSWGVLSSQIVDVHVDSVLVDSVASREN